MAGKGKIENLVPFTGKGDPRNGPGPKKGSEQSATRLRRLLEMTSKAINPVNGAEEEFTALERMDAAQIIKALAGDTYAYREILDRFEGRAKEEIKQIVETQMRTLIVTPASQAKKDKNKAEGL